MNKNKLHVSEYALDAWENQLGSPVVEQLEHKDWSQPYEVDEAHLFRLENNKYAVVIERGCSCYDYSDADITVYDSYHEALKNFPG